MDSTPRRVRLRTLVLTAVATFVGTLAIVALAAWLIIGPQGLTLLQGTGLIQTLFVGEYDDDAVLDGAIRGMIAGTGDRWSYYVNQEEYRDLQLRNKNAYVGVGITVSYEREDGLLITEIQPGGPADEAGLVAGDVVIEVDGTSIAGEARQEGPELMRGEAGTQVTLNVLRADGETVKFTLTRERVESHPASAELLDGDIGLVTLRNFYDRSAQETKNAVDELVEQGAKALIFDVRDNPGGYLEELIDLLDYLLPEGPIFASHTKNGPERVSESDADCIDLPMAVLVNEHTYSSAELFAAQLKESVGARVIGMPTSGKGFSQQTFPLPNGGAMALSTGQYTTGKGVSLIGTGVALDEEVEQSADDAQLTAAVRFLIS